MTQPAPTYLVGIDVGKSQCTAATLHTDKTPLGKPFTFPNSGAGFAYVQQKLARLDVSPDQVRIGLEATGAYWVNLY